MGASTLKAIAQSLEIVLNYSEFNGCNIKIADGNWALVSDVSILQIANKDEVMFVYGGNQYTFVNFCRYVLNISFNP